MYEFVFVSVTNIKWHYIQNTSKQLVKASINEIVWQANVIQFQGMAVNNYTVYCYA